MENKIIHNVLSTNEINSILNISIVKQNKKKLENSNTVKFTINVSDEIKNKIETVLGINLLNKTSIPMRWVKGDTLSHIDKGEKHFNKTHLIYLNDSIGSLVVDGKSYNIASGNAHIFSEGLEHYTINTGTTERLMIGPMSETGFSVGEEPVGVVFLDNYYPEPPGRGLEFKNINNNVTIFNFPPPNETNNEQYYIIYVNNPVWSPPTGKTFLGWKLLGGNPLGNNDSSKIYIPGETYSYNNGITMLYPIWSSNVRIDLDGVDGTNRCEIISGNTLIRTKNNKKNKLSHTDILNIKKARASRSYY
jgi:hypothetical protein